MTEQTGGTRAEGTILEVSGLSKVFGRGATAVKAVNDVDLTVRRGEVVLIMGPSGSGKTTLLTMIGGLLKPTDGAVRIDEYDITAMKESELYQVRRRLVGFIFQVFNLLEPLNVRENVEVVLNLAGKNGRGARRKAEGLLQGLGLGDRLNFRPDSLSGGEKQRVSIARALANDPQLILADEPTANLDSKQGHDVVVLLRDIAKKQGRTVVIVSHDHRIREVADRVLWLEDGRIEDISRLERDPNCGMAIEPEKAHPLTHEGRTYYFCSAGCRREFEETLSSKQEQGESKPH